MDQLVDNDIQTDLIAIVMGRGGLIKPVKSGIYAVNKAMIDDLKSGARGEHPNNLGALIAQKIAEQLPDAKAFIADPVVVDELEDLARVSGHPQFERKSVFHALSQKSVARKYAKANNLNYNDINLIVVHMESGVSIGAHRKGKVVDVNQTFDGAGPFSSERAGTLPVGDLLRMAFSGKYTKEALFRMINEESGYKAYLGTSNHAEIEEMIRKGNKKAEFISNALAYQIAKSIGGKFAVLEGECDGILFSGEPFHCKRFVNAISKRVEKFAPISVYPNEDVIESMAMNGLRLLKGEVTPQEYV
jgi:butyrate kinase